MLSKYKLSALLLKLGRGAGFWWARRDADTLKRSSSVTILSVKQKAVEDGTSEITIWVSQPAWQSRLISSRAHAIIACT